MYLILPKLDKKKEKKKIAGELTTPRRFGGLGLIDLKRDVLPLLGRWVLQLLTRPIDKCSLHNIAMRYRLDQKTIALPPFHERAEYNRLTAFHFDPSFNRNFVFPQRRWTAVLVDPLSDPKWNPRFRNHLSVGMEFRVADIEMLMPSRWFIQGIDGSPNPPSYLGTWRETVSLSDALANRENWYSVFGNPYWKSPRYRIESTKSLLLTSGISGTKPIEEVLQSRTGHQLAELHTTVHIPDWSNHFTSRRKDWKHFWSALSSFPIPFAKEVETQHLISYRALHPGTRGWRTRVDDPFSHQGELCVFCNQREETWSHLFNECPTTTNLYYRFSNTIIPNWTEGLGGLIEKWTSRSAWITQSFSEARFDSEDAGSNPAQPTARVSANKIHNIVQIGLLKAPGGV